MDIDTTSNSHLIDEWYTPHTIWDKPKVKLYKLNPYYSFDVEKALDALREIKSKYKFGNFPLDGNNSERVTRAYKGIGFTARKNATDPLYDANYSYNKNGEDVGLVAKYSAEGTVSDGAEVLPVYERDFCVETELYQGYFKEIIDKFKSTKTKVRLLELRRGGILATHVDFPYYEQVRLHAVLSTNEQCYWEVEGERFQIPVDGNFYWFDTGRLHAVWNGGQTDRVVLSVNLSLYKNTNDISIRSTPIDELLTGTEL